VGPFSTAARSGERAASANVSGTIPETGETVNELGVLRPPTMMAGAGDGLVVRDGFGLVKVLTEVIEFGAPRGWTRPGRTGLAQLHPSLDQQVQAGSSTRRWSPSNMTARS
jgi:hypothetical protein